MKPPRGLTAEEAAAWERVAATVAPLKPRVGSAQRIAPLPPPPGKDQRADKTRAPSRSAAPAPAKGALRGPSPTGRRPPAEAGLDSHWDRRFARGVITPDFTLDLHGHTLDQAHARLDDGLAHAKAMGARVVLVIAGKPRAAEAADRGTRRGAIRAKLLDWLAAGPHGRDVVAVRSSHRRHGGEGAL